MLDWLNSPTFYFLALTLVAAALLGWKKRGQKKMLVESREASPFGPFARDASKPGLRPSAQKSSGQPESQPFRGEFAGNLKKTMSRPENVTHALNALQALSGVEINSTQKLGSLQVFGLKWSVGEGLDYATLDEALRDKVLEVTEISEGGQVPAVKVENKSGRVVFLMAGELLVGCKQDRVLNTSIMVPSTTEMPIPVACVEAGRWGYRSRKFSSAQTFSHSYLRMILSKETSARYMSQFAPGSGQGAVWAEVARKMNRMGSSSSSNALQDMFKDYDKKLNQLLQNLSLPKECHGAAFATNGTLLGLDLFDKHATFVKLWPKLAKSYAVDALEDAREDQNVLQSEAVLDWTKAAQSAKQGWFDSPGLGQDVRIEGDMFTGGALVVEQRLIHLQLFRKNEVTQRFNRHTATWPRQDSSTASPRNNARS
jgi:hypothetical protein